MKFQILTTDANKYAHAPPLSLSHRHRTFAEHYLNKIFIISYLAKPNPITKVHGKIDGNNVCKSEIGFAWLKNQTQSVSREIRASKSCF